MSATTNEKNDPKFFYLEDNGKFPNSSLPVILYKKVLPAPSLLPFLRFRRLFKKNDWVNSWLNGIYDFHHYHSMTHEVLGICRGSTTLLLGGDNGITLTIEKGDVLIIPAGVAHKKIGSEKNFLCVGAYPDGREYDMNYGNSVERPQTDKNIKKVPLPGKDPIFGATGELRKQWMQK